METQLMPIFRMKLKYGITERQLRRILETIKRRHKKDQWLVKRTTGDLSMALFIRIEGVEWVEEVYLNKNINYVDAEIQFALKHIQRLEKELDHHCPYLIYEEMNIDALCDFFERTNRSIYSSISKMEKELPHAKSKKAGKVFISAEGVQWLEEHVFRKKYWEDLNAYKRYLQDVKQGVEVWQEEN